MRALNLPTIPGPGSAVMAKITIIKERGQVLYWTRDQSGCDVGDLLAREPLWAGRGLVQFGLKAGGRADPEMVDRLMAGCHPVTGEVLVVGHTKVHPDAKLDATGFAAALRERRRAARCEPGGVAGLGAQPGAVGPPGAGDGPSEEA